MYGAYDTSGWQVAAQVGTFDCVVYQILIDFYRCVVSGLLAGVLRVTLGLTIQDCPEGIAGLIHRMS